MVDRILLIGFMCTGKSTVGRLVAERLAWEFVDFDDEIERMQNMKIVDVFHQHGESFFRSLEARLTEELEGKREVVLAPGGGWITQPGLVNRLRARSIMVWLRARPETVYERHRNQSGVVRPLLETKRPLETIRSILTERTPLYRQADAVVDTDELGPAEVAGKVAELVEP